MRDTNQYHLDELKIARDPNHPSHTLPPSLPPSNTVLDIGCGAGQTLIAAYPDRHSFGLDIDFNALRLGRTLTGNVCFVCGRAEALPYRDQQFDMVISRVCLAYTNLPRSLKEARRVLKTGGRLWVALNPFSVAWQQVQNSNYKGKLFFAYIVVNSILFSLFQKQFGFLGRFESFQTERGVRRTLRRNGFEDIAITRRGAHFVVSATAA